MKRNTSANLSVDTAHYDEHIVRMMDETETCLNCGVILRYIHRKEGRRNRGYCRLQCYYDKPPKLAYAEKEWGMPAKELLIELLNKYTVQAAANLMGVEKPQIYNYMKKYNVRRHVVYK